MEPMRLLIWCSICAWRGNIRGLAGTWKCCLDLANSPGGNGPRRHSFIQSNPRMLPRRIGRPKGKRAIPKLPSRVLCGVKRYQISRRKSCLPACNLDPTLVEIKETRQLAKIKAISPRKTQTTRKKDNQNEAKKNGHVPESYRVMRVFVVKRASFKMPRR